MNVSVRRTECCRLGDTSGMCKWFWHRNMKAFLGWVCYHLKPGGHKTESRAVPITVRCAPVTCCCWAQTQSGWRLNSRVGERILWSCDRSAEPLTLTKQGSPFGSLNTCQSGRLLEFFSHQRSHQGPGSFPLPLRYPQRRPSCLSPCAKWLLWLQMPCLFLAKRKRETGTAKQCGVCDCPFHQRWADDSTRLLFHPPLLHWTAGKAEKGVILAMVGCTCHG